ncbi:MAG: hypothetical protein M3367_02860 [Acidobacteriota bacterium]|nr:hypothetical protein [Acidobacteriota bacterium]
MARFYLTEAVPAVYLLDDGTGGYLLDDADATAFFTASGITDATQKNAIDNLVFDLKSYGLWTKLRAIYPFVGGTAATHKWNLKNPADTDAAFRLSFLGGWTHSATGALPNGTTGYANTFFVPNTVYAGANSGHISYYSRTNTTGVVQQDMGAAPTTADQQVIIIKYGNPGNSYFYWGGGSNPTFATSDSRGYFMVNRNDTTNTQGWKNGVKSANLAQTSALSTIPIFIGAINSAGAASSFTDRECAFATIGDGLTDTEAANLNTAVANFQTDLGRAL